ncbi:MAG: hypothetical protein ACM336_05010 [Acidobacteriota bacterium]
MDRFRRFIYSRWFYALLACVCLLDAAAETLDLLDPGSNPNLDWISLVASVVAALLALAILIDLHSRRKRP